MISTTCRQNLQGPMPSSARELQAYPYIPRLTECFGAGPSGHNPFPLGSHFGGAGGEAD